MTTLDVYPTPLHVEHALAGRASIADRLADDAATPTPCTLAELEGRLVRALLPKIRVASAPLTRIAIERALRSGRRANEAATRARLSASALTEAVATTLATLHAAGIDAPLLEDARSRLATSRDRATCALLVEAVDATERELARLGVVDAATLPMRLARAIADATPRAIVAAAFATSATPTAPHLRVRHVLALVPARLAWLESLHRKLRALDGGLEVEFPIGFDGALSSCGLDDPRDRFASEVERRWSRLDDAPELATWGGRASRRGPLADLADALFLRSKSDRPAIVDGALTRISADGATPLADAIASDVEAHLARGVAPEKIAIVAPRLDEEIVAPIRAAFRARRIALFEGAGASADRHPIVAAWLRALSAIGAGASKQDWIAMLRAGHGGDASREAIASALASVPGNDLRRDGRAIVTAATRALREPRDVDAIEAWFPLVSDPPRATQRALLDHAKQLWSAIVPPRLARDLLARIVVGDDEELHAALAADDAAREAVTASLRAIDDALTLANADEDATDLTSVARAIARELSGHALHPSHRAGAVALARLIDRPGIAADHLVIVETHEEALPRREPADPLLPATLRAAIAEIDPARTPTPRGWSGVLDLLAVMSALTSTTRTTTIAMRARDEQGTRLEPGIVWRATTGIEGARERVASRSVRARRGSVRVARQREIEPYFQRESTLGLDRHVVARAGVERRRAAVFEVAANDAHDDAHDDASCLFDEAIDRAGVAARLADRLGGTTSRPVSSSRIERLLACRFAGFAESVIRARVDEEVDEDGGAIASGTLAHAALEAIYKAIGDELLSSEARSEDAEARLVAEVSEIAARVIDPSAALNALQRRRREQLVADVAALVAADRAEGTGERTFVSAEISFGLRDSALPPLVVGAHGATVALSGKIDRLDRRRDGAIELLDYKRKLPVSIGNDRFFAADGGANVQLPIYAIAVARLVDRRAAVRARYASYADHEIGGYVGHAKKSDEAWARVVGDAAAARDEGAEVRAGLVEEWIVDAVARVREGDVTPREGPRCGYCPYASACRLGASTGDEAGDEAGDDGGGDDA